MPVGFIFDCARSFYGTPLKTGGTSFGTRKVHIVTNVHILFRSCISMTNYQSSVHGYCKYFMRQRISLAGWGLLLCQLCCLNNSNIVETVLSKDSHVLLNI